MVSSIPLSEVCCGKCGCAGFVAVAPRLLGRAKSFLNCSDLILSAVATYGSPLNIVFPEIVLDNYRNFQAVFSERSMTGKVLCTTKPNKSMSVLKLLAVHGASLDVSSEKALAHALTCGTPGRRCQASGPKAASYLGLAIQHEALISIDSVGELEQLRHAISRVPDQKAKVLIRLASESAAIHALDSQFGLLKSELGPALDLLAINKDRIELVGFHHHLYSPTEGERSRAFEDAFDAVRAARHIKLNPTVINLGGGMRIRYAESSEEWSRFEGYLKDSVTGVVKPVTWNNSGLGYSTHQGKVVGSPAFIDPVPVTWGAKELERVLDIRLPRFEHQTIGRLGADALIDLYVEPGRAMFDQAGLTVARVIGTKKSAQGHAVLSLEMNHSNLRSGQQKLLTQPVFIPCGERKRSPTGFFLTGNLCTTHDVIQQQKVYPGFVPEQGDLVVFCNTAAYLMDFAESEMLHQPTARKLAVFGEAGAFRAVLDEVYSPWDMKLSSMRLVEARETDRAI